MTKTIRISLNNHVGKNILKLEIFRNIIPRHLFKANETVFLNLIIFTILILLPTSKNEIELTLAMANGLQRCWFNNETNPALLLLFEPARIHNLVSK